MIMRKRGNEEQSKLVKHIMSGPIRILKRLRELYMKGMQGCAGEVGYGDVAGYSTFQISQMPPQSFDVKPLRAGVGGGADPQKLLRKVEIRNYMNVESQTRLLVLGKKKLPDVRYDGTRRMGRIDEDKPCYFEEDRVDMKTRTVFYPRRSYFQ